MAEDPEWLTALLRCMPGAAMILEGDEVKAVNAELPELFGIPRARIAGVSPAFRIPRRIGSG